MKDEKRYMIKILKLFYIINICITFLSFHTLYEWKKAEIEHNTVVLVGIVGMNQVKMIFIISILIFVILTVIFIKNKKRNKKK